MVDGVPQICSKQSYEVDKCFLKSVDLRLSHIIRTALKCSKKVLEFFRELSCKQLQHLRASMGIARC